MRQILLLGILSMLSIGCSKYSIFVVEKNTLIETNREVIQQCNGLGLVVRSGLDKDLDGILSDSEVNTEDYLCDGTDGVNGQDGTVIELVNPCGDGQGHDEVLMIMDNGTVLAWYKDLGLTILEENKAYTTTDKQKCKFKIINSKVIEL